MKRDEFGLKPPHHSYVDMIERLSDGVQVDVVNRRPDADSRPQMRGVSANDDENNRRSYRSSRVERD
jgi:hypothetical protein